MLNPSLPSSFIYLTTFELYASPNHLEMDECTGSHFFFLKKRLQLQMLHFYLNCLIPYFFSTHDLCVCVCFAFTLQLSWCRVNVFYWSAKHVQIGAVQLYPHFCGHMAFPGCTSCQHLFIILSINNCFVKILSAKA